MTAAQLIALAVFVVAMVVVYARPLLALVPSFAIPVKRDDVMDHIQAVVDIRSAYRTPEVQEACNNLLRVLLGVRL